MNVCPGGLLEFLIVKVSSVSPQENKKGSKIKYVAAQKMRIWKKRKRDNLAPDVNCSAPMETN